MGANTFTGVSAAVLAGGLGTRLRSVVADRPKVLAPVAGRPFLAHLLDQLGGVRIAETVLLVGHLADRVRAEMGDQHGAMRIRYSTEPEPLGTGGAVRLALPLLSGETILLLNGDSYCNVDLTAFQPFHAGHDGGMSLVLANVENAARFGRVQLDGERVTQFEEKDPTPAPGWINAGVYLIDRRMIEAVPTGRAVSLERNLLPNWTDAGAVFGFCGGGRFIDIGVPESYAAAEAFFSPDRRGVAC